MTTSIYSTAPSNASDAAFRDWGSKTALALAAVGMVQTADTGQINWTTVTAPTSTTFVGYEIWRFNDALQATVPIFFKLEYGSNGAQSAVNFRITVGKGSNGSGTITSIMANAVIGASASTTNASVTPWYASSADGSQIAIVAAPALSTGSVFCSPYFVIERSRSAAGAATNTGLLLVVGAASSYPVTYTYNYASGARSTAEPSPWPCGAPFSIVQAAGLAAGGRAPMFPAIVSDGAGNYWQPRSILAYAPNDAGAHVAVTVSGFGTYLPINRWCMSGFSNGGGSGQFSPGAIAWS